MATTTKTCSYKGRTYKLLWIGKTKFGRRAKLGFQDGSKEFWVSADQISENAPAQQSGIRSSRSSSGMYCGYPCPVTGRKCCAANGPCHDCE